MVWKLFPFKGNFSFGKIRSHSAPSLGCRGLSHLGDLMFCKRTAQNMKHEWACCRDEAAKHQLPIVAAFWVMWIVSMEECSSLTQNLMQMRSVILPYSLGHFECDGHTVHMLTRWHLPPPLTSTVKLSLFTHAHSSPLSLAARTLMSHKPLLY